jgi:hypothetical protein
MASLAEIRDLVIDILLADTTPLHPTPFSGGVWPRLPRVGSGNLSTPGAFYPSTDPQNAGKLRPTISVIDGGYNPAPGGVALNGFQAFPLVYGYSTANASGEAHLGTLGERLHAWFPLRGRSYPLGIGGVELKTLERQPIRDADEFGYPGRIFAIWRLQGTFIRS